MLAKMIVTTATVRRGGTAREVPFDDLVPGDLIELSAVDLVPAQCAAAPELLSGGQSGRLDRRIAAGGQG